MKLASLDCRILRESAESQNRAGRYNPARVVKFDGRRHVLPVGDNDSVELYRVVGDSDRVYCVSINRSLGYCGVQGYDPTDQEPDDTLSVFLPSEEHILESVGDLDKLTDRTIARRLIDLLSEVVA